MKEQVEADPELARGLRRADRPRRSWRRSRRSDRGRRFIAERVGPTSRSSAGTRSGATSSSSRASASRWSRSSSSSGPGRRRTTTTRVEDRRSAGRHPRPPPRSSCAGLEGEALRGDAARPTTTNLRMAPLTPDHHFYIDQGANAHVRQVLLAVGEKLVELGVLDAPGRRDPVPLQRAAGVHRRPAGHRRARDRRPRRRRRPRARVQDQAARLGRHGDPDPARLPVPQPMGLPREVPPRPGPRTPGEITGRRGLAGRRSRASARVVLSEAEFDAGPAGRHPRLRDDQPGLAGAVPEDRAGSSPTPAGSRRTRRCSPASTRSRRSSGRRSRPPASAPATGSG